MKHFHFYFLFFALGSSIMPAAGTMYLTTSTGYPYTYHNGVAYFHTPEVTSVPPSWPVSNFHFTRVSTKYF